MTLICSGIRAATRLMASNRRRAGSAGDERPAGLDGFAAPLAGLLLELEAADADHHDRHDPEEQHDRQRRADAGVAEEERLLVEERGDDVRLEFARRSSPRRGRSS